eukprot:COSAG02_NODE_3040_length_7491_cov_7.889205_3_plen_351_part_00
MQIEYMRVLSAQGVPGIGTKKASALLQLAEPQTLEGVLQLVQDANALHHLTSAGKVRKPRGLTVKNMESLRQNACVARLCRQLATIETIPNVAVLGQTLMEDGLDALQRSPVDDIKLEQIITSFPALRSLKKRLTRVAVAPSTDDRTGVAAGSDKEGRSSDGMCGRAHEGIGSEGIGSAGIGSAGWSARYRVEVVGAHFASAGKIVLSDGAAATAQGSTPSLSGVTIAREPKNAHDPLALAVYLPLEINGENGRSEIGQEQRRLGYVAGWLAQVLSPLIDDGKITIEGNISSKLRDWSAALSRRRLPLEIRVIGQAVESHHELTTKIELLREAGGPASCSELQANTITTE